MLRSVDAYDRLLERSEKASSRAWRFFVMFLFSCTLYWATFNYPTSYEVSVVNTIIFVIGFAGGLFGVAAALLDKSRIDFAMAEFFAEDEEEEGDASTLLDYWEHEIPSIRLYARDENQIKLGRYELSHADWRILYFALHDRDWHWSKANVTKARRNDNSLIIPNLTGAAFSELEAEFRKLQFFHGKSRKINGHGRRTLREAANLSSMVVR